MLLTVFRFGPYTVPIALLLLLLAVLPAGPSRKDLIPWLPLFIVFCSLGTVAIDKASNNLRLRRGGEFVPDELSGVSFDSWSDHTFPTASDRRGRRPPSQSNRLHPIYFGRYGPSSQYSHPSRSESDITLGGVVGQIRQTWDTQTRGYFDTGAADVALEPTGQVQADVMRSMEPEEDQFSESQSNLSDHPLLGSQ